MTLINKCLLKNAALLPLMWLVATLIAGVVTWWHGYAIYFIYVVLIFTIVAGLWVLFGKAAEGHSLLNFIFFVAIILSCIAFNVYGLVVLFFPQLKGWGNWDRCSSYSCWPDIYFQLPNDFNYTALLVFFSLLFIYGGKKFFELDLESMKKKAYKRKEIVQSHVYFIDTGYKKEGPSFEIIFKPRFLVKSEHWLHAVIVAFCCYVILPFGGVAGGIGSSMANSGNSPFMAAVFFVFGYFFLCLCVYILVQTYGRYRLIHEIEKELGVKLKPALGHEKEFVDKK